MMKKILLLVFTSLALLLFFYNRARQDAADVTILQIVEHDALNATRRGIEDHLKSCCPNIKVSYKNAQGSMTLATQAAKSISTSSKAAVALGTVAAQAFLKDSKTPCIFGSVTDPIAAGLVQDLQKPDAHFTGVSNMIDLPPQLKLMLDILPAAKKIGVIYNSAETNSISILKEVKAAAAEFQLEIVEAVIASSNDAVMAVQILAGKGVDAIFISNDNTALSAMQAIVESANTSRIPVFCSDIDTVERGVLAALGPDQYHLGVQTGKIVENIVMHGQSIANIPVQFPEKTELRVNLRTAQLLGITIKDELLDVAKVIK